LREADRTRRTKIKSRMKPARWNRKSQPSAGAPNRYDLAEVFLEIAPVVTLTTLLSGRRFFWHVGLLLGVITLAMPHRLADALRP
jgi:hypothetical protein